MKHLSLLVFTILFSVKGFGQLTVLVGPYLQSPSPDGIKIMWRTNGPCTGKVMYGTNPSSLLQVSTDPASAASHTVELTGLNPGTRYFYAIYNDTVFAEGGDSAHSFRTFPVAGTNTHVRTWAIGDFGKGNDKQIQVRDAYENYDTVETDLWLWLGDNVYDSGLEQEYLDKVFDSVYGYQKLMKGLAFEPCPGNHDYTFISPVLVPTNPLTHSGPYFDLVDVYQNAEAGGVASGNELYYSFDYGNVHFVSLNSELGSLYNSNDDWIGIYLFGGFNGSPMTQWLHQDLTANTLPWVVVYFHQPPYTDGSHDADQFWEVYMQAMRENLAEIWEQYGVDLVLSGHSHVYERSFLVKGAYGDASAITPANILQDGSGVEAQGEAYVKYTQGPGANEGTVYVVNGNSGSSDDAPGFTHPYMYAEYGCDTCCGSFVLDIDSNRLDGRHLDMYGNIQDHFTIFKVFGPPIGIGESISDAFGEVTVSPNPSDGFLHVHFQLSRGAEVVIHLTDPAGREEIVFSGNLGTGKQELQLQTPMLRHSAGTYLLRMESELGTVTKKVVVQ